MVRFGEVAFGTMPLGWRWYASPPVVVTSEYGSAGHRACMPDPPCAKARGLNVCRRDLPGLKCRASRVWMTMSGWSGVSFENLRDAGDREPPS